MSLLNFPLISTLTAVHICSRKGMSDAKCIQSTDALRLSEQNLGRCLPILYSFYRQLVLLLLLAFSVFEFQFSVLGYCLPVSLALKKIPVSLLTVTASERVARIQCGI